MGEPSTKQDFFVSYSSEDSAWAEWIAFELEENGYTVVLQAWDFRAGGNFVVEMDRAARECERTLAVLSPAYCHSFFATAEWAAAFREDPTGDHQALIPVRVEDFSPDGLLGPIVYVDLVGLDEESARKRLLEEVATGVESRRRKPETPPSFPAGDEQETQMAFPGALPAIWNLPIRLRNFAGRDELMDRLGDALPTEGRCALFGLGGVGKTRAAVEFAYREAEGYDLVWRIRARDTAIARGDLAGLATPLGLPEAAESEAEAVDAVRAWLSRHERWLLILDDAVEPDAVAELIPPAIGGQVLVTTQAATGWGPICLPIEISVFDEDEAAELLGGRLRAASPEDLRAVAAALGHLPLALEQAVAFMEATGVEPSGYLERLAGHSPDLFAQGKPVDYELTIASTWELAMTEIEQHTEARSLLVCCALLAPEKIPRGIFDGEIGSGVAEPAAIDSAIAMLRRFSLVSVDGDQISVHQLVQWAVRQELSKEMLDKAIGVAQNLLYSAWPIEDAQRPDVWPLCATLASHMEALARRSLEEGLREVQASGLLASLARYLRSRGALSSALELLNDALVALDAHDAPPPLALVHVLSEYGVTYSANGEHEKAVELHTRALELIEKVELDRDSTVASAFGSAARAFAETGDLERGRELLNAEIDIYRGQTPVSVHNLGSALSNLGNVVLRLGDFDEARRLKEEGLELLESEQGPGGPEVGIALAGLASVQRDAGDFDAALDSLSRAKRIFEQAQGPESLELARSRQDRAIIYVLTDRYEEAKEELEQAVPVYRDVLGPRHRFLRNPLMVLALCHARLGDAEASQAAFAEAERIGEEGPSETYD